MTEIPQSDVVSVEIDEYVATVWLDRPDKLNAMAPAFWSDFPAIIEALSSRQDVRAIVVAGRGRAFTVGLDLPAFAGLLAGTESTVAGRRALYERIKAMQHTFSALAACPQPVIAAIHGYCLGGGLSLITACDIRLAARQTTLSLRETKLGMVADVGALQRLPTIVNAGTLADIAYTGRDFDATEAVEMGLVNRLFDDFDSLLEGAHTLARQIAANSPLAVQGAKHVLRATAAMSLEDALDYMAIHNSSFLTSDDLREAFTAHLEGRDPNFTGA